MMTNKQSGQEAENLATEHLLDQGYEILERNWHFNHLELDIIARKNGELIIVEVKSRFANSLTEPYNAVNRSKQQFIISATNAYILKKNLDLDVRFDIISIVYSGSGFTLEHIENAFYPRVRNR